MTRGMLVGLGLWVLAAHTYGEFPRVRDIVVHDPVAARPSVRIPLASGAALSDPYVVLILRARNDADAPLTVTVSAAGQELGRAEIAPRSTERVDLAWPHARTAAGELELHGDRDWRLDAAEIANVHGFTRGALNFIVLPNQQPFRGAPLWLWLVGVLCGALTYVHGPARWSRWPAVAHRVLAAAVGLLFLGSIVSPLVSRFHIVLAAHTVAIGFAILGAWGLWRTASVLAHHVAAGWQRAGRSVIHGIWSLRPAVARSMTVAARLPWFRLGTLAAIVGYVWFLWPNIGSFAGGADSSGYFGSARLLLEGHVRAPVRALPGAPAESVAPSVYMPLGFRTVGWSEIAPSYPVGLPLLVAAAPAIDLETKAAVVMAAHAVAGAFVIFWLALECGLSRNTAALAALLLASSPVYLFMSLTLMSDVPALVWTTAAVVTMWRSRRDPRWALAAGVAISMAVLIRSTSVLGFAPLAVCAGRSPRRWLLLVAGGLPGAALFVGYNLGAYGAALTTGYVDHDIHFGAQHIVPSLRHYAVWLPAMLTPIVVFALGLPALREPPTLSSVLLVWIAAYLGFYTVYSFTNDAWWYTRFLLPAFPALIVSALWVGRVALVRTLEGFPFRRRGRSLHRPGRGGADLKVGLYSARGIAGAALLGALVLVYNIWWAQRLGVVAPTPHESQYLSAARWVRAHLPQSAGLVSMQMSGSLFHYTSRPIVRWDFLDGDTLRTFERTSGAHPLYAVLHPVDVELAVRDKLQGNWIQVADIEGITVWRFNGLTDSPGAIPADERWFPLISDH